jgi:alkyl hydroperoxide reductase subunit AhpC
MRELRTGRAGAAGALLGFVIAVVGVTAAGSAAGLGAGAAFGLSLFVGLWGGLGFGFMTGATLNLARYSDAAAALESVQPIAHQLDDQQRDDQLLGEDMALKLGETAPDFTAETTEGRVSLHDYLGSSWGILFSHPADFTPVCTTELGEFALRKADFDARDTKLIGVSVDSVESHRSWSNDIADVRGLGLNFPLIGDEDRHISTLYGMIHPEALETATVRTVFVIAPDKSIKLTLTYPAAVGRNVDEIIRVLDALQLSSQHAVATPVNWISGDDVIISPAVSDDEAVGQFPKGFTSVKPYLRVTPQPNL